MNNLKVNHLLQIILIVLLCQFLFLISYYFIFLKIENEFVKLISQSLTGLIIIKSLNQKTIREFNIIAPILIVLSYCFSINPIFYIYNSIKLDTNADINMALFVVAFLTLTSIIFFIKDINRYLILTQKTIILISIIILTFELHYSLVFYSILDVYFDFCG
jgi:hypothetical protein